jgi:hypothetical protein
MRRMHASGPAQRVTLIAVLTQRALILWTFFGSGVVLGQTDGVLPADTELERSGAVIGEILIENANVFDLSDPRDDTKLFRLADHLHAVTRKQIIRWTLLFKPGDRFQRRVLEESERLLRSVPYFYDATVIPVGYHDGKVDVLVRTRDVWTFDPAISYGRSGGTNSTNLGFQELNIFGSGAAVQVGRSSNVDRTQNEFAASDPNLEGTRFAVSTLYSLNSDGYQHDLFVDRPFYALDSRWTSGVAVQDDVRTDSLYDRGNIIDQFQEHDEIAHVYGGWSHGLQGGWASRYTFGATFDDRQFYSQPAWTGAFLVPEDRKLVYPWVRYELVQDDFLKYHNYNQIERTEDFALGTHLMGQIGWSDSAFGANVNALVYSGLASYGIVTTHGQTLLFTGTLNGRLDHGTPEDAVLSANVHYFLRQSDRALFFAGIDAAAGRNLDVDDQILLGGDNGLRGYPLRYQDGSSRAVLSLEERYYSDWYPFRLARVGGAAFMDLGRTWGSAPLAAPSLGMLKDIGFGLRLGMARSGLGNVIHVDLAFPLDASGSINKVQFLVTTKATF